MDSEHNAANFGCNCNYLLIGLSSIYTTIT